MRVLVLEFAVPEKVAAKWKETVPMHPNVRLEAGGAKLVPFRGRLLPERISKASVDAARKGLREVQP